MMNTAFFSRAYIEVPGIHEGNNHNTEHVLVEHRAMLPLCQSVGGHRQAAGKITQSIYCAQRHRCRPEPCESRTNDIFCIPNLKIDLVADDVQILLDIDITR